MKCRWPEGRRRSGAGAKLNALEADDYQDEEDEVRQNRCEESGTERQRWLRPLGKKADCEVTYKHVGSYRPSAFSLQPNEPNLMADG